MEKSVNSIKTPSYLNNNAHNNTDALWQSPGRRWAGESSTEAEAVYRHCLQILSAEMIKILRISHNTAW